MIGLSGGGIVGYTFLHTRGEVHVAEAKIEEAKTRTASIQNEDEGNSAEGEAGGRETGGRGNPEGAAATQRRPAAATATPPSAIPHARALPRRRARRDRERLLRHRGRIRALRGRFLSPSPGESFSSSGRVPENEQ